MQWLTFDPFTTGNDEDQGRNSSTQDAGRRDVDKPKDDVDDSVRKDDEGAGSVDDHELQEGVGEMEEGEKKDDNINKS